MYSRKSMLVAAMGGVFFCLATASLGDPQTPPATSPAESTERALVDTAVRLTWDEIAQRAASERRPAAEGADRFAVPYMEGMNSRPVPMAVVANSIRQARPEADLPRDEDQAVVAGSCSGATGEPVLGANFQALPDNGTVIPPDTMGAVGPNHVVTMLNSEVLIQTKVQGCLLDRVSLSSFWSAVTTRPFDPHIVFDSLSNRWIAVVTADSRSAASRVCFAVSATDDPTGSWTFFFVDADGADAYWADYPGLGVNSTWIAVTVNMFTNAGSSFGGAKMWVVDKAALLSGGPFTITTFPRSFDISGQVYGATLQPALTFDASETIIYIVDNTGWFNTVSKKQLLRLSRITGTGPSPAWSVLPGSIFPNTGLFEVVNNFYYAQFGAAQLGTSTRILTNDPRMLNAVFRNGRLWCTHTGAHPPPPSSFIDRTVILWYQLNPAALPSPIVQSGVLDGGFDVHHFFPSISANCGDDACVGFTRSDATRYAEAAYACRAASDAPGTMRPVRVLKGGEDAYFKDFGSGRNRWGDYSATCVDPSDDRTFWTLQEYAATSVGNGPYDDRWGTWWGELVPPSASAIEAVDDAVAARIVDCNNNTIEDGCDIILGTSEDCNANVIPDECDLGSLTSLDCNGNARPDECDLGDHISQDCNGDGIPDECEPECNGNSTPDICDIGRGTSLDCNVNGIPDECESPNCPAELVAFDVNSGGDSSASAAYSLRASTGQYGGVGTLTSANYSLLDGFWHGVPVPLDPPLKGTDDVCVAGVNAGNACAVNSDCPGGFCRNKNRFVTAEIPATATSHGLKLTVVSLDANSVASPADYNGTDRWVGTPTLGVNDGISPAFNAAKIQCAFQSQDWSAVGRLHIYGDIVVPLSTYELYSCDAQPSCSSPALPLGTAKFGDVVSPVNTTNFQDVNSIVAKFQGAPSGPSKTRAKLTNSIVNPANPINFQEVSACVSAFQSKAFKTVVTAAPVICP